MTRDIKIQWKYNYPPEKIWEMLTNLELIKKWIPKISDFKPIEGFEYEQHQKPRGDWDGIIYHKIKEIVPFKKLSYTFQSGPEKGKITMDTLVSFTIKTEANGTTLQLEHKGFKGFRNYFTSFILELGWKNEIAKKFDNILNELNK